MSRHRRSLDPSPAPGQFSGGRAEELPGVPDFAPNVREWLRLERSVNERLSNPAVHVSLNEVESAPLAAFAPGRVWEQQVVFVRAARARSYGGPAELLRARLGLETPRGRVPILLHPASLGAQTGLPRRPGVVGTGIRVTPTASYRSLLAVAPSGAPELMLKLSLPAELGEQLRVLREPQIVRALLVSSVFDTIPDVVRSRLGLEWFPERAGAVEVASGCGYLLRELCPGLRERADHVWVPMFSLAASPPDGSPPLLWRWSRAAGEPLESVVARHVLGPYVRVLAYLVLEEGLCPEGHAQNVLFEVNPDGNPTGRVALRDLSDASVNVALRAARRKPLPVLPPGFFPRTLPFSPLPLAMNHTLTPRRDVDRRAWVTLQLYGADAALWSVCESLARRFPRFDRRPLEAVYRRLWQRAAVEYLGVEPELTDDWRAVAIDEAIAHAVARAPWDALGARGPCALEPEAEALLLGGRARRRRGRSYRTLDTGWGRLFIEREGRPAFIRAARVA